MLPTTHASLLLLQCHFPKKKKKKKKGKIWLIQAGFTGLCNALFLVLNRYSNFTFKIIFCFGRLGGNR